MTLITRATIYVSTITAWSREFPDANISILLDDLESLVIDLDSSVAQAEAAEFGLPATMTRHSRQPAYIYKRPPEGLASSSIKAGNSKKIDLLTQMSLVVFGQHAQGHDVYLDDIDGDIADAPAWAVTSS